MSRTVRNVVGVVLILCLVALVSWMIFTGIENANQLATQNQQATTRDHQNSALIAQNRVLIAEVKADNANAASDRAKAARNQLLLLNYTRQLDARQSALLAYLRRHGIKLPTRLVTVIRPPVLEVIGSTSKSCTKHGARCKK